MIVRVIATPLLLLPLLLLLKVVGVAPKQLGRVDRRQRLRRRGAPSAHTL